MIEDQRSCPVSPRSCTLQVRAAAPPAQLAISKQRETTGPSTRTATGAWTPSQLWRRTFLHLVAATIGCALGGNTGQSHHQGFSEWSFRLILRKNSPQNWGVKWNSAKDIVEGSFAKKPEQIWLWCPHAPREAARVVPSKAGTPPPWAPPFCLARGVQAALWGEGSLRRLT